MPRVAMKPLPVTLVALGLPLALAQAQPVPLPLAPVPRDPSVLLGSAADVVGDVTGDGRPDVLIGAPTPLSPFITDDGRAYLFDGATGAFVRTLVPPATVNEAPGFGGAVAGMGDLDGDGLTEVAVAGRNVSDPLRVFVYAGADGALVQELAPPGAALSTGFGQAIAGVGDLDGDGVGDLLVGAPNAGDDRRGEAYVFSGATGAVVRTLTPPASPAPINFGYGTAALGDLDGDGVTDVAVGDIDARTGPGLQGVVHVFSGATGTHRYTVSPSAGPSFGRFGDNAHLPVAGLDDVDGDGTPDFAVGAPLETVSLTTEGRVYVFSGADGGLLYRIEGTDYVGMLGTALAGVPDVDGDGAGDLVVGGGGEGGPGTHQDGPGRVHLRSGATGAPLMILTAPEGVEVFDGFGEAVAGFVEEGALRLVAGAPHADVGDFDVVGRGWAFLYTELPLAVVLEPVGPHVVLPPGGGEVTFTATVTNVSAAPQAFEAWTAATLPGGATRPVLGPLALTLQPGQRAARMLRHRVPASAPTGTYVYAAYVGAFPAGAVASARVMFTKSAVAPAAVAEGALPAVLTLHAVRPSPFAREATLRFDLPKTGPVRLAVYDVRGREVAVLAEGVLEAGRHEATLDGRGLAAGVYLARLAAGGRIQTQRLVLAR